MIAVAKVHVPQCDHRRYPARELTDVVFAVWATAQSHFQLTISFILSQHINELGKNLDNFRQ